MGWGPCSPSSSTPSSLNQNHPPSNLLPDSTPGRKSSVKNSLTPQKTLKTVQQNLWSPQETVPWSANLKKLSFLFLKYLQQEDFNDKKITHEAIKKFSPMHNIDALFQKTILYQIEPQSSHSQKSPTFLEEKLNNMQLNEQENVIIKDFLSILYKNTNKEIRAQELRDEVRQIYRTKRSQKLPFYFQLPLKLRLTTLINPPTQSSKCFQCIKTLILTGATSILNEMLEEQENEYSYYWRWKQCMKTAIRLKADLLIKEWREKFLQQEQKAENKPCNSETLLQRFQTLQLCLKSQNFQDPQFYSIIQKWIPDIKNQVQAAPQALDDELEKQLKWIKVCFKSELPEFIQIGNDWINSNAEEIEKKIQKEINSSSYLVFTLIKRCTQFAIQTKNPSIASINLIQISQLWTISKLIEILQEYPQEYPSASQLQRAYNDCCKLIKILNMISDTKLTSLKESLHSQLENLIQTFPLPFQLQLIHLYTKSHQSLSLEKYMNDLNQKLDEDNLFKNSFSDQINFKEILNKNEALKKKFHTYLSNEDQDNLFINSLLFSDQINLKEILNENKAFKEKMSKRITSTLLYSNDLYQYSVLHFNSDMNEIKKCLKLEIKLEKNHSKFSEEKVRKWFIYCQVRLNQLFFNTVEFELENHYWTHILTDFHSLKNYIELFHTLTKENQKEIEKDNSFNSKIVKVLLNFEEKSKNQFDEALNKLTCKEIFFL